MPPTPVWLLLANMWLSAYLDVSLANRGVKALSLAARSDPAAQDSMKARRERLAAAGVADIEAMGWDDAEAAAQLLAAMTREVSALEFDAGRLNVSGACPTGGGTPH